MTGSFIGQGNQYIQLVNILHCKFTICKKLSFFPHRVQGLNHRPQSWEVSVSPLCHHGPYEFYKDTQLKVWLGNGLNFKSLKCVSSCDKHFYAFSCDKSQELT